MKRFKTILTVNGKSLFLDAKSEGELTRILSVFAENPKAERLQVYERTGRTYDLIADEAVRKIGFQV